MNVFVIFVMALMLLVVSMRLWFRWFSRRPLSGTDEYAVAVDAAVDDATAVGGGRPPMPTTADGAVAGRLPATAEAAVTGPATDSAPPTGPPVPSQRGAPDGLAFAEGGIVAHPRQPQR